MPVLQVRNRIPEKLKIKITQLRQELESALVSQNLVLDFFLLRLALSIF